MTNSNPVVAYELIAELRNKAQAFNPKTKGNRKNSFGRITNGYLFKNNNDEFGWISLNPLQTRSKMQDTPVYAVYADGTRVKTNSHAFFAALCSETWIELKCDLAIKTDDGELLDEAAEVSEIMWSEERDERPTAICWRIDADLEKFKSSLQDRGTTTLKSGKLIRNFEFRGELSFVYSKQNLSPVKPLVWPIPIISDEEYNRMNPIETPKDKVANQAAKAVVSSPILKQEIAKEDVEEVVVSEEEMTAGDCDEVNALFADSQSSPQLMW